MGNNITREDILDKSLPGIHKLEEPMIGYKKIYCQSLGEKWTSWNKINYSIIEAIVELEIPIEATIVRPIKPNGLYNNKLRTNIALVKKITPLWYKNSHEALPYGLRKDFFEICKCHSIQNPEFMYVEGKICVPEKALNTDINIECASGIHFFMTRLEAERYMS